MDKVLKRQITKALKLRRRELQDQIGRITRLLEEYEPTPELRVIPLDIRVRNRIRRYVDGKGWRTYDQIRQGIGYKYGVRKMLIEMVVSGELEQVTFNKVVHYRKATEHMTLRAGYGEVG